MRYGLQWPETSNPLAVEFAFMRAGGYMTVKGKTHGEGLFHHYRAAQSLMWPEDDHHRWSDLMLKTILENRITAVCGSRDSSKTYTMAKYALTDYFAFSDCTLCLISSTHLQGLKLRVWGTITSLLQRAKDRFPWIPGNAVESLHGIFTDTLSDENKFRDIRRGIIAIPCLDRNGAWTGGLSKFVGIKQKRRRLLGDEVQFMHVEYMDVLSNLDKGDFKGVFVGNPYANLKALDKVAEPIGGWENHPEAEKTNVFKNKFGGTTIELVGTDSPNFDYPEGQPDKYEYLVTRSDEKSVGDRFGRDSANYYSQIKGVRKAGLFAHRVLTEDLCLRGGAFKDAVWHGEPRTKIYALDAGFGGDRCVVCSGEFGIDVTGHTVLKFNPPAEIEISILKEAEIQIADRVKKDCLAMGIPGANMFFDAGMRATLATTLAKMFSPDVNAVNFGGNPTRRPVSATEFIIDQHNGQKRLKRCDEAYEKFVTEMYFSVRLAVMAGQIRELPKQCAAEFYQREWTFEAGDKYEIETKKEMKARTGESPDYADCAVILVEGARRLGFSIETIPEGEEGSTQSDDYLAKELQRYRNQSKKRGMTYA